MLFLLMVLRLPFLFILLPVLLLLLLLCWQELWHNEATTAHGRRAQLQLPLCNALPKGCGVHIWRQLMEY